MNKVVFVNAYEFAYLGTRVLASWLRQNGIPTHNICLKDYYALPANKPEEKAHGYQCWVTEHGFVEHCANSDPVTATELELLAQCLEEEAPTIIGFSARSANNFLLPLLVPVFKRAAPKALLVAGGFGPTLDPSLYLDSGFDVVVKGDGEDALLRIAQNYGTENQQALYKAPATQWSAKWGGYANPLADQVKGISIYPPPLYSNDNFSYIDKDTLVRRRDPLLEENNKYYYTYLGRGCTGRCTYCSGGNWTNLYRREGKKAYPRRNREIEDVLKECKNVKSSLEYIHFVDEFWSMSSGMTRDFFTRYHAEVRKPFFAYLNYSIMMAHPDLLDLVIRAGLYKTAIGFQTGSESLALRCYQRKQDYELLLNYARTLYHKFVPVDYHFIGGNCYETEDDFWETIDILQQLPFSLEVPSLTCTQVIRLVPHPASPIRTLAPNVVSSPMPVNEWYLRTVIMALAPITSIGELKSLYRDYRGNPYILHEVYRKRLAMRRLEWFNSLGSKEEKFVLYGSGELYNRNKHILENFSFDHILLDAKYMPFHKSDAMFPIADAEEFLKSSEASSCSYLIAMQKNQMHTARKLLEHGVQRDKIHVLPDLVSLR